MAPQRHFWHSGVTFRDAKKAESARSGYQIQARIPAPNFSVLPRLRRQCGKRVKGEFSASVAAPTQYGARFNALLVYLNQQQLLPAARTVQLMADIFAKYDCLHGLCNTHHLRELLFLFEEQQQAWAGKMIEFLLDLHRFTSSRKENPSIQLTETEKVPWLAHYRAIIGQGWQENPLPPPAPESALKKRGRTAKTKAQNLLVRLAGHEASVLAFLHDLKVPFTNNLGEQDIHMLKVRMKISGCFRTLDGAKQFARIRGYLSTTRKNGLNLLDAMTQVFQGTPVIPSG